MATVRTPRGRWITTALHALAGGGPDAVRIEALAAQLGVSKGGFYWHFPSRQALIDEMLDVWERSGTDDVVAVVEREPGDARTVLRRLFELAPSDRGFAVEIALRDWARRDLAIAERLHRVDNRRMAYVRSLFAQFVSDPEDVEARSLLGYALVIGSNFIAAEHGERTRAEVVRFAAERLLSKSWR